MGDFFLKSKLKLVTFSKVIRINSFVLVLFFLLGSSCGGVVKFLLAEQGVRGSNMGLATSISEIGALLFPSRNMTER